MLGVTALTKRFGPVVAVDDLTFSVRPGAVTGFLGPNGAGKTTTLRMLLGLTTPTGGTTAVGDRPYTAHPRPARVVGAALEASSFHPGRTGLGHLRVFAAQAGAGRKPSTLARRVAAIAQRHKAHEHGRPQDHPQAQVLAGVLSGAAVLGEAIGWREIAALLLVAAAIAVVMGGLPGARTART